MLLLLFAVGQLLWTGCRLPQHHSAGTQSTAPFARKLPLYLATYGGNATQSKFLCRHSSEQRQAIVCRCSRSKSTTYTNTKIDDRAKIQYSGTFRQRLGDFKLISCDVNNLSQQKLNQPLIAILKEFWDFLLFLPFLEQEYF